MQSLSAVLTSQRHQGTSKDHQLTWKISLNCALLQTATLVISAGSLSIIDKQYQLLLLLLLFVRRKTNWQPKQ